MNGQLPSGTLLAILAAIAAATLYLVCAVVFDLIHDQLKKVPMTNPNHGPADQGVVLVRDGCQIVVLDAIPIPAELQRELDALTAALGGPRTESQETTDDR